MEEQAGGDSSGSQDEDSFVAGQPLRRAYSYFTSEILMEKQETRTRPKRNDGRSVAQKAKVCIRVIRRAV